MRHTGNHTWDIFIAYHRCPSCDYISESREDYQLRDGKEQKDITCMRCGHVFTLTKVRREKEKYLKR